jgi:hypothetical protein
MIIRVVVVSKVISFGGKYATKLGAVAAEIWMS